MWRECQLRSKNKQEQDELESWKVEKEHWINKTINKQGVSKQKHMLFQCEEEMKALEVQATGQKDNCGSHGDTLGPLKSTKQ